MAEKYYKVVNKFLDSARASEWDGFSIKYKIGEFVYPTLKNSKLFVFDNLESAKDFAYKDWDKIFECEVVNPSKAKYMATFVSCIEDFWAAKNRKESVKGYADKAVSGTIFCDAVKLIKKVE